MIQLDLDELLALLTALAHREGYPVQIDRRTVIGALEDAAAEAELLATGHAEHEPAALLFALGRRSVRFRPVPRLFIAAVLRAHAVGRGYELDLTDLELTILSARIALGQIDFSEVRGAIAARLRPFGQTTPRRPRPRRPR